MKHFFMVMLLTLTLTSCGQKDDYPKADNALVAAQDFLDACMKGDFKRAGFYIVQDSTNQAQLKELEAAYYRNTSDQRVEYRSASIIVENDEVVSPAIEIITYHNSYDKTTRKLKAINDEGEWKIDVKYTFSGNL